MIFITTYKVKPHNTKAETKVVLEVEDAMPLIGAYLG
jgi:hypothetical protein